MGQGGRESVCILGSNDLMIMIGPEVSWEPSVQREVPSMSSGVRYIYISYTRGLIRPKRDTFSFLVVFCRTADFAVHAHFTDGANFCGEHVLLLISRDPISGLESSCYSRIYRPVSVTDIAWLLVLRASCPSLRDRIRCRFEKVVAV